MPSRRPFTEQQQHETSLTSAAMNANSTMDVQGASVQTKSVVDLTLSPSPSPSLSNEHNSPHGGEIGGHPSTKPRPELSPDDVLPDGKLTLAANATFASAPVPPVLERECPPSVQEISGILELETDQKRKKGFDVYEYQQQLLLDSLELPNQHNGHSYANSLHLEPMVGAVRCQQAVRYVTPVEPSLGPPTNIPNKRQRTSCSFSTAQKIHCSQRNESMEAGRHQPQLPPISLNFQIGVDSCCVSEPSVPNEESLMNLSELESILDKQSQEANLILGTRKMTCSQPQQVNKNDVIDHFGEERKEGEQLPHQSAPPIPANPQELSRFLDRTFSLDTTNNLDQSIENIVLLTSWAQGNDSNLLGRFTTYGVIGRTLDFLQDHLHDRKSVMAASNLIVQCTLCKSSSDSSFEQVERTKNNMQSALIQHNGISTLLRAAEQRLKKSLVVGAVDDAAICRIWMAVEISVIGQRDSIGDTMTRKEQASLAKVCCLWIKELPAKSIRAAHHILLVLTSMLGVCNHQVIAESRTTSKVNEIQERVPSSRIFKIENMMKLSQYIQHAKGTWIEDEEFTSRVMCFFSACSSSLPAMLPSSGKDYRMLFFKQNLFPLCIRSMQRFQNSRLIQTSCCNILYAGSKMVPLSYGECPGILSVLSHAIESRSISLDHTTRFKALHVIQTSTTVSK